MNCVWYIHFTVNYTDSLLLFLVLSPASNKLIIRNDNDGTNAGDNVHCYRKWEQ